MSSLNIFQKYQEQEQKRAALVLNPTISAILDYCEYSTRGDFNQADKARLKSKNRKRQLAKEFIDSFTSLSREEKVEFYLRVVGYLTAFARGDFSPPRSERSGMINDVGFSRSFNVKRWKEKKLRMDQDRHILYAEREVKIKNYEMKDYLLRRSKNKDYFSFVLEAINSNPPEKSRTVHIGFTDRNKFEQWFASIKFSIEFREWELFLFLYKGKGAKGPERTYTTDDIIKPMARGEPTYSMIDSKEEKQEDFLSRSMVVFSNQRTEMTEEQRVQGFKQEPIRKQNQLGREKAKLQAEIRQYQQKSMPKTLVDELMEDVFEEPDVFEDKIEDQGEAERQQKKHLDLFHKLCPQYQLQQLQLYTNFEMLQEEPGFRLYQHRLLEKRLKMVVQFSSTYDKQQILSLIAKPEATKTINDNIQEVQVKTNIPSENSALMYQVLKPYNRLYRPRDFVFIRHVFSQGKSLYMVDKSIENANYPPFMTIVRGQLTVVYGIFPRQSGLELIADFQIVNEGYLNPVQETNLTLKYLRAFVGLPNAEIEANSYKFFDLEWDIAKNEANQISEQIRTRRKTINLLDRKMTQEQRQPEQTNANFSKKQPHNESPQEDPPLQHKFTPQRKLIVSPSLSPPPSSLSLSSSPNDRQIGSPQTRKKIEVRRFDKGTMQQVGELNAEQQKKTKLQTALNVVRQLDGSGRVIIDNSYRKGRYLYEPLKQSPHLWMEPVGGHPIWRGEWIHDDKEGGMIFINKKKIEDQKGVLKFVLTKIAKNILSGQSILSISLPVDIFAAESNIQRFLYSMLYAPLLLEKLQTQNLLVRLARTVAFGVSNSLLYLSMEKPFNPILGETFQCWVNGCPAYAEQISHHPPIAALLFKGRGYTVSAQLQSKVSLAVNSGTGINEGTYKVRFEDGVEICFMTPGGELSGLTAGDRKFNIVGKSYYWVPASNIVLELAYDPFKKGFFSVGKQQEPSDYFEGVVWEVRPEFMVKFQNGKRKEPEEKDRIRELGKINGNWHRGVRFNGEEILNFDRQFPLSLEYEQHPLPSDANWREDIEYRRRNETTRAQTEKERLQVIQRKDRKLREKFHKKK